MESYLQESCKIDGSNFTNWKFKIQTLLEDGNSSSIVTVDEQRVNAGEKEQDWEKRENKVKVLLKMSMKDNIIPHTRDCKMFAEI